MRKIIFALSAAALAGPATVIPTDSAEAQYRTWRGKDGRVYCRRPNGTTGLIVGGVAGGVLGNVIAPGGSGLLGTVLGAAGGALAGRAVDRSSNETRCR